MYSLFLEVDNLVFIYSSLLSCLLLLILVRRTTHWLIVWLFRDKRVFPTSSPRGPSGCVLLLLGQQDFPICVSLFSNSGHIECSKMHASRIPKLLIVLVFLRREIAQLGSRSHTFVWFFRQSVTRYAATWSEVVPAGHIGFSLLQKTYFPIQRF